MPTIRLETRIAAPPELCFDLARDMKVHTETMARCDEHAVAGITSGPIGMGESVTLQAVHFGIRWQLTARIVEFNPPHFFVDVMESGPFRSIRHRHEFIPIHGGTSMRDTFEFASPFGILGRLVDRLWIERYMTALLRERAAVLRDIAQDQCRQNPDWKE